MLSCTAVSVENSSRPSQPDRPNEARPKPKSQAPDGKDSAQPSLSDCSATITEDDWCVLLEKTEKFAAREIARYCWREVREGVVPDGYDANSIAAEAIAEYLRDRKAQKLILAPNDLRKLLRKSVRKIVNRLHHRMENEMMVSECDLNSVFHEDGEVVSPLEGFSATTADPAEEDLRNAELERLQEMKQKFILFLGEDQLLKDIFDGMCEGLKRAAIARKLKLSSSVIKNAQARLDRRLLEFRSGGTDLRAAA